MVGVGLVEVETVYPLFLGMEYFVVDLFKKGDAKICKFSLESERVNIFRRNLDIFWTGGMSSLQKFGQFYLKKIWWLSLLPVN